MTWMISALSCSSHVTDDQSAARRTAIPSRQRQRDGGGRQYRPAADRQREAPALKFAVNVSVTVCPPVTVGSLLLSPHTVSQWPQHFQRSKRRRTVLLISAEKRPAPPLFRTRGGQCGT